jgi:hypothetical protein
MSTRKLEALAEGPPQPPEAKEASDPPAQVSENVPTIAQQQEAVALAEDTLRQKRSRRKAAAMSVIELQDKCDKALARLPCNSPSGPSTQ